MFLAAAGTLAGVGGDVVLATGTLDPPLTEIRTVPLAIAPAVAEAAWQQGAAQVEQSEDV